MPDQDPQMDTWDIVALLFDALKSTWSNKEIDPVLRDANTFLYERLIDYKGLLCKRGLTRSVEFLVTRDNKAGWYYAGGPAQARNWVGPFQSERTAKLERDKATGVTRNYKRSTFVLSQLEKELYDG